MKQLWSVVLVTVAIVGIVWVSRVWRSMSAWATYRPPYRSAWSSSWSSCTSVFGIRRRTNGLPPTLEP